MEWHVRIFLAYFPWRRSAFSIQSHTHTFIPVRTHKVKKAKNPQVKFQTWAFGCFIGETVCTALRVLLCTKKMDREKERETERKKSSSKHTENVIEKRRKDNEAYGGRLVTWRGRKREKKSKVSIMSTFTSSLFRSQCGKLFGCIEKRQEDETDASFGTPASQYYYCYYKKKKKRIKVRTVSPLLLYDVVDSFQNILAAWEILKLNVPNIVAWVEPPGCCTGQ